MTGTHAFGDRLSRCSLHCRSTIMMLHYHQIILASSFIRFESITADINSREFLKRLGGNFDFDFRVEAPPLPPPPPPPISASVSYAADSSRWSGPVPGHIQWLRTS